MDEAKQKTELTTFGDGMEIEDSELVIVTGGRKQEAKVSYVNGCCSVCHTRLIRQRTDRTDSKWYCPKCCLYASNPTA
ncbi:MAG: hypothetical protein LUH58_00585 [Lachnospiraceae bacterium]|nr:hypothetical protein [Lachnospiraceae bacterium]